MEQSLIFFSARSMLLFHVRHVTHVTYSECRIMQLQRVQKLKSTGIEESQR